MSKLIATCLSLLFLSLAVIIFSPHTEVVGRININTASLNELKLLPCLDSQTAGNIVAFREHNGPFSKIDDLLLIKGITSSSLLRMQPLITLDGDTHLIEVQTSINPFVSILDDAYSSSFMRCIHRPVAP